MKRKLIFLFVISLFIINSSQAQGKKKSKKIILKGVVLDSEDNAVENAFVFIDDILSKSITDNNGHFKLKFKQIPQVITVVSIEKGIAESKYQGEEEMTFMLVSEDKIHQDPLNKVAQEESDIVNDGISYKRSRSLTSKIEAVKEAQLAMTRQYNDIYDMIRGKIPGVQVNGNNVVIRGSTSFSSTNKALFVVDGRQTDNIDYISPNEVESISVLKSTNLYGSAGANGVIVIKLKKTI
jgi:hypothetical protein